MTRYAIDAQTLLAIATGEVAVHPSHQLVAPNRVRSEALELLYDHVRRGELDERVARSRHERLTEVKVRLLGDRVSRWTAWTIAREHNWPTLADAEYLAVARLQSDAFVTVDPDRAARATGIVLIADVSALAV